MSARLRWDHEVVSVVIRGGAAQRLVVEPGDRVRATGRFKRFPDGDWLDLAQVVAIAYRPSKGPRAIQLLGADAAAVPDGSDRSLIPDHLRVVGVRHGDAITVEEQEPVPWPPRTIPPPLFTGDEPAGGWDNSQQLRDVDGLQQLRDAGQIVRDGWLRTNNDALILRVAASDVDAVEAVLAPQLPRRLYVVRSRYTAAQLREVEEMFAAHYEVWGFESWSCTNLDAQTQPYADAMLLRVTASLATWAENLPDGLLILTPAMTPA